MLCPLRLAASLVLLHLQSPSKKFIMDCLNEAIMLLNKSLQDINIRNMNAELVAQMFKNYQSNVLFHLEATDSLKDPA
ncbi:DASH complex subunit dad4 [Golovinomyces cichoracearum]|uniref:DASH complex subunit DAD4 n=1 Tax=Golovinomyces cichoracearum TaxID=62708 RepID=A0A420IIV3_9PEZI|nr:DASH complex subunit dad4 [Golovinomyces cichoracearum]